MLRTQPQACNPSASFDSGLEYGSPFIRVIPSETFVEVGNFSRVGEPERAGQFSFTKRLPEAHLPASITLLEMHENVPAVMPLRPTLRFTLLPPSHEENIRRIQVVVIYRFGCSFHREPTPLDHLLQPDQIRIHSTSYRLYVGRFQISEDDPNLMSLPEPQSVTFSSLFAEIEAGTIKIPQFQRDFVWTKEKSAKLIDSIVKGYPIGTFILWKTTERLRSIRNLGGISLQDTPKGDAIKYVLDGQQRLTSLFVSLKGLTLKREEKEEDFSQFWVDLGAGADEDIVLTTMEGVDQTKLIRLRDLLSGDFAYLATFPKEQQDRIRTYKNRIESYQFSAVLMKDAPIDVATEVFTRLNVGGVSLSVFEIMVAKTFDPENNFDLSERYDQLKQTLESADYGTISPATVLQVLSVLLRKECRSKDILSLPRAQVVKAWPEAVSAISAAVDYFRNYYRIPVSSLLPYPALLVPFSYFFYKHPDKPLGDKQRYLHDFFWRVSLGGRYSQSLETRLAQDILRVDSILHSEQPDYDWPIDVTPQFIARNGYFSTSRSFIKAILCVFAHREPKSFADGSIVRLDNSYLKQANSRNYHHFFPKAFLEKHGDLEWWQINHVANITLVDDFLNKRLIGARPPGVYMKAFIKQNPNIERCLATHLIKLTDGFGVMSNEYDRFFSARCKAISRELQKQIIPQAIDLTVPAKEAEETVVESDEGIAN